VRRLSLAALARRQIGVPARPDGGFAEVAIRRPPGEDFGNEKVFHVAEHVTHIVRRGEAGWVGGRCRVCT
jgi:hypothetical protein